MARTLTRDGAAAERRPPGHWAADLRLVRTYGQALPPSVNATPTS